MKLALISPASYLDKLPSTGYHMILAPQVVDEDYATFYASAKGYKILDNGAAEGRRVDNEDLMSCASLLGVDEVVIPDCLGDAEETIFLAEGFEEWAAQAPGLSYMGVVQGESLEEILECAQAFARMEYISVLGLPRHLCSIDKSIRLDFCEQLPDEGLGARFSSIHCLGSSSWIREVVCLSEINNVRGLDTALPVVMGLRKIDLVFERHYWHQPHPTQFFKREISEEQEVYIARNIETYRKWIEVSPTSPV